MIIDKIEQLQRYAVPKTQSILKFIAEHDCTNLPDGELEIEGRELFVRVMGYKPKPAEENKFEIHRHYADLQYVVSGAELMQTAPMKDLTPISEYDVKGDYLFFKYSGVTTNLIVPAATFVVFYPNQPHRPGCLIEGQDGLVKKLVFKIKID